MKGVILAGGTGTRLKDCTKVTNKHLLPVYDKPMIYFPLESLKAAGLKDILIVTGRGHSGDFLNLLGDGRNFGLNLSYAVQEEAGGIAQALHLAKHFVGEDSVAVILGDNIFEKNFENDIKSFVSGARIFLKKVPDPKRFGVAVLNENNEVKEIIEKPKEPPTDYAVTGFYIYDSRVFDIIETLKPSDRGELELTDVNNYYVKSKEMDAKFIEGFWSDAGTPSSLYKSAGFVRKSSLK
ncbi:spore coat protein [archaeon]|nr:spore coat protein [archaeon]|tara:strand:+ start:1551 stop:2264 length:714 start_codon:yes stop_codon:yes gene_type:complete